MSIPVPNLDDRTFADLVAQAHRRIQQVDPTWTDLSVHDPGIVLVEAFAHLTDLLTYRLNRVPERLYAVFLNLLGTSLGAPSAAQVVLEFTRERTTTQERIPRGVRIGCLPGLPGAPQPVFATLGEVVLEIGQASVRVQAADVSLHDAVLVGTGTGLPGQTFTVPDTPLVAGPGLSVGIEVPAGAPATAGEAVSVDGRTFRLCREVAVFADASPAEPVVRVDRSAGTITFPWFEPEAGAGRWVVPEPGAAVLAWYRCGGGERGNVPAGSVVVPRDGLPGHLKVTNPDPAVGGRDGEPLERALRRAPQEFQARDRAVTARDYEVLASRHGGVERACALTRRDVWAFAAAGEVEVVIVPHVPLSERPGGRVGLEALAAQARPQVRAEVDGYLRTRATIGADPVVAWASYKQVVVEARVVVRPDEDPDAVRSRIVRRLTAAITPIPDGGGSDYGSGFGRPLRVSNLYRAMEQSEPGVLYVDQVRLRLDQVPDSDATGLVRAPGQPGTWFVAQGSTLFRTTNAADGWEVCAAFGGADPADAETIRAVVPWPAPAPGRPAGVARPGLLAVATDIAGGGAGIHVSEDLGQTWRRIGRLGFGLADLAWIDRGGSPVLLAAGEKGLYELALAEDAVPVQNIVDLAHPDLGLHAVESFVDVRGRVGVAVCAEASAGVWLSTAAGAPESFRQVRAPGEDIRCLSVQYDGPAVLLWAGRSVPEGDGTGCLRLRIDDLDRSDPTVLAGSWDDLRSGWTGGSVWAVAVIGDQVYAATQSGGLVGLVPGQAAAGWRQPDVNCGLPLRDRRRFAPVRAVSGAVELDGGTLLLAAGPQGVYRSRDGGVSWRSCAQRVVDDVVTLPSTWLFCSGQHQIEVVRSDG